MEVAVFDKIMENPLKSVVMEGAAFAKENDCDFIVALGCGAVLDSSIAVSTLATNPGDLWDYVNGGTGKGQPLVNPGLPIVTIALSPLRLHPVRVPRSTAGCDFQSRYKRENRFWIS